VLRVHRIPYSTNVERVALAGGHKGLAVEWVDHEDADRTAIRALSGQDLVPVAELDGEVVVDSMRIVERLEAVRPDPPLYPRDPAARARLDVFVAWFNRVWKVAPNAITDGHGRPEDGEELAGSRDIFEGLLAGGPYLLGDELTAADVCAFPFLKWAAIAGAPADAPRFEHVLVEHLALGNRYPRLRTWIERIDALPRA
jgi:maleylacetoacetate isomerase/maleylpyruvate isomerase